MISTAKVLKIIAASEKEQEAMIDNLSVDDLRYLLKILFKQVKGKAPTE